MANDPKDKLLNDNERKAAIVSSSHLASQDGWQLSELEYALTMTYNAFSRWMTHCISAADNIDLNPLDILVLHNVNHRSRDKKLSDIAFMLNIDDSHVVNYALKKLVKIGLVQAKKTGKETFYSTTARGREVCDKYREVREACLVKAASAAGSDFDEISRCALILRGLSGLYDQASRAASSL